MEKALYKFQLLLSLLKAWQSTPLGNTFGFRQLREQRLEKCGLCPITLHFSRPLIGGSQATVVQSGVSTIHTGIQSWQFNTNQDNSGGNTTHTTIQ